MNDKVEGTDDPMRRIVKKGVDTFALVEDRLQKLQVDGQSFLPLFDKAREAGMMGLLQASRMKADAKVALGRLAEAEAIIFALHREATDIAIAHGVDQVPDGGGGVVVLGGGPR
jgi:hypothetical protein